jgi:membrane protein implicated in regulation of membrane protease activity
MYIIAIAWMFVVLLMTAAEATAPNGTVLGAFFTLLLYGLLPLSVLLYILGTPGRKRARRAAEAAEAAEGASAAQPDGGGHAAGAGRVAPEAEEA